MRDSNGVFIEPYHKHGDPLNFVICDYVNAITCSLARRREYECGLRCDRILLDRMFVNLDNCNRFPMDEDGLIELYGDINNVSN